MVVRLAEPELGGGIDHRGRARVVTDLRYWQSCFPHGGGRHWSGTYGWDTFNQGALAAKQ